jgi:hypothetical protein
LSLRGSGLSWGWIILVVSSWEQSRAKQSKAKQSKAKQSKAKQSKAKVQRKMTFEHKSSRNLKKSQEISRNLKKSQEISRNLKKSQEISRNLDTAQTSKRRNLYIYKKNSRSSASAAITGTSTSSRFRPSTGDDDVVTTQAADRKPFGGRLGSMGGGHRPQSTRSCPCTTRGG